jgi:hypothetical protein
MLIVFPQQQWLRERASMLCYSTLPVLFTTNPGATRRTLPSLIRAPAVVHPDDEVYKFFFFSVNDMVLLYLQNILS